MKGRVESKVSTAIRGNGYRGLTGTPGIGQTTALGYAKALRMNLRVGYESYKSDLPFHFSVENQERRIDLHKASEKVMEMVQLGSTRGIRIRRGLPSHGQRTQSNGNTAKRLNAIRAGVRKASGAAKGSTSRR